MNQKALTFRYSLHQLAYWAAAAGIMSFATTFLLTKGFPATQVGTVLASGSILSCITQPVLAEKADRNPRLLFPLIVGLTVFSGTCFAALLLQGLPSLVFALLYLLGVWSFDAMMPLLNSVCVRFIAMGCAINYGVTRAVGSASFAVAALGIGYLIQSFGADSMILLSLMLLLMCMLITLGYPRTGDGGAAEVQTVSLSCSVPEFFRRYRWYCLSLLGVLFLAMFHAMTENYLISIFERLGGDSSNVGTALFISSMSGAPVIFFYAFFHKRLKKESLLKIAALTFLLKAILFCLAPSIGFVYALEVLQATSYAFLGPTQVFYAGDRVKPADMVKGQAFIAVAYTLGCSAGNFAGGQLLTISVDAMLFSGVAMALTGLLILLLTLRRSDVSPT